MIHEALQWGFNKFFGGFDKTDRQMNHERKESSWKGSTDCTYEPQVNFWYMTKIKVI